MNSMIHNLQIITQLICDPYNISQTIFGYAATSSDFPFFDIFRYKQTTHHNVILDNGEDECGFWFAQGCRSRRCIRIVFFHTFCLGIFIPVHPDNTFRQLGCQSVSLELV